MDVHNSPFSYHDKMAAPGGKPKGRIEIKDEIGNSFLIAASKQKGKPNFLEKHLFTYIKDTSNNKKTYYKINKNSFVKRLGVEKTDLKSGIYDNLSMNNLLKNSSSEYQKRDNSIADKMEIEAEDNLLLEEEEKLINGDGEQINENDNSFIPVEKQIIEHADVDNGNISEIVYDDQIQVVGHDDQIPEVRHDDQQVLEKQAVPKDNNLFTAENLETYKKYDGSAISNNNSAGATALLHFTDFESKIVDKEHDVKETKKQEFDKKVTSIFAKAPSAPGKGEIVVAGYVLDDGMGDYFHMRTCANKLTHQFPERPVRIVAVAGMGLEDKLQPPKGKEETTHIAYGPNYAGFPDKIKKDDFNPVEKINNASLVVMGPVGLDLSSPGYGNITEKLKEGIKLAEYDYIGIDPFYKKSLGMGLADDRLGLFSPTAKDYSWDMVESANLRQVLFEEGKSVDDKNVFFSYVGPETGKKFINHVVAFSSGNSKDIDLISPSRNGYTRNDIQANFEQWKSLGVGSVKIITFVNGVKNEELIPIMEGGKQLRLINSGPVPSKDFKILTKLSSPLMACTGDKSLEKALLYGKIPAYDVRDHKAVLYANLLREVKVRLGPDSTLLRYCMSQPFIGGPLGAEAERILSEDSEKLVEEAKIFGEQIMQDRSFNSTLKETVNQELYLKESPELNRLVQKLEKLYENGEVTLDYVHEKIQAKIDSINKPVIGQANLADLENQGNQTAEKVKDAFNELELEAQTPKSDEMVKKEEFDTIVKEIFTDFVNPRGNRDIVIMGYIPENGVEGYKQLQICAKDAEKRFPTANVKLVIVAHPSHENKLQEINTEKLNTHIAYSNDSSFSNSKMFGDFDLLKSISRAGVVVGGPESIDFSKVKSAEISYNLGKGIKLSSNDDILGIDSSYKTNMKMGFSKNSLGILNQTTEGHSWDKLENENLKEILFADQNDSPNDQNLFFSSAGRAATCKFIDHAVNFSANNTDNIHIVSTSADQITSQDLTNHLQEWEKLGVGSVKIVSFVDGEAKEDNIQISESGKQISFINSGSISNEDQAILAERSSPLMACADDISISDVFSLGKIPAYEVSSERIEFYANLLHQMKETMGADSVLYNYCKNQSAFGGPEGKEAVNLLTSKKEALIREAKVFGEKITQEHSFNSELLAKINEHMSLGDVSDLMENISKDYIAGNMTADDVKDEIQSILPKAPRRRPKV